MSVDVCYESCKTVLRQTTYCFTNRYYKEDTDKKVLQRRKDCPVSVVVIHFSFAKLMLLNSS